MYHKELPTITFTLDEYGYVNNVLAVENEAHVHPFLLINGKLKEDDNYYAVYDRLSRWMAERNIPASRKNLSSALQFLGLKSSNELAQKCFYLSLSDQYWIAPTDAHLNWNKLNFFTNDFSEDVGMALFGYPPKERKLNLHSPDANTVGRLVKRWIIENENRVLVKGGSGTEQLEPFNEVLTFEICKRLGIPAIKYSMYFENRRHFCKCNNFLDENTELITAGELCEDLSDWKSGYVPYEKFKERCNLLNISLDEEELGKMFVLDYIIANEDRHLNNFGFIRDVNTLEWKGLAPVYDSGSSMFYSYNDFELENTIGMENSRIECKPFNENYINQIFLFPYKRILASLDLDKLDSIGDFYKDLLKTNQRNVSESKINRLSEIIEKRIEVVKELKKVSKLKELSCVKEFKKNIASSCNGKDNFEDVLKKAFYITTNTDDKKKELLSFYVKSLNTRNEKELTKKLYNIITRNVIKEHDSRSD